MVGLQVPSEETLESASMAGAEPESLMELDDYPETAL